MADPTPQEEGLVDKFNRLSPRVQRVLIYFQTQAPNASIPRRELVAVLEMSSEELTEAIEELMGEGLVCRGENPARWETEEKSIRERYKQQREDKPFLKDVWDKLEQKEIETLKEKRQRAEEEQRGLSLNDDEARFYVNKEVHKFLREGLPMMWGIERKERGD